MSETVRSLAELVHGRWVGNGDQIIQGACPLEVASDGDISFVENDRHLQRLHTSRASALVVSESLPTKGGTVIRVADPLAAFVTIVRHFQGRRDEDLPGIDARAVIDDKAHIGPEARIGPFVCVSAGTLIGARCHLHAGAVIGRRCRLGDDVTLYPHVVLYDDTVLGDRVIIHSHSVIGADGFGYRLQDGRHVKVPQLGHVEIGADVEIGAGSAIDRGTFQATRIGEGTKIDNLVQVGHNCQIGRHNLLAGQVGIAGSCHSGDYVVMAGQVGVADHVHLGDRSVVGARAGVMRDVGAGERVFGTPAKSEHEQKRLLIHLDRLPELHRDVRRIKQHLGLKDQKGG
jgi:UDP-3-O-[3-hydroxymyristoyl] glucosamine N-acyltransferase